MAVKVIGIIFIVLLAVYCLLSIAKFIASIVKSRKERKALSEVDCSEEINEGEEEV